MSLLIPQEEIRQGKKRETLRINLISNGATSCLAKSNSLFEGCPHSRFSVGLLTDGIKRRHKEMPWFLGRGGGGDVLGRRSDVGIRLHSHVCV